MGAGALIMAAFATVTSWLQAMVSLVSWRLMMAGQGFGVVGTWINVCSGGGFCQDGGSCAS